MHPLKKALLRFLLDEQPGQVYMRWHTVIPGATTGGQCRDYVQTTDPRFLNKKRGTREALIATARRSAGMPRERLISRLYRWHMERQGKTPVYPLDVPVLVKHWSSNTKAEVQARKAGEAYEVLSQAEKDKLPACGYRGVRPPRSHLPSFLERQHGP